MANFSMTDVTTWVHSHDFTTDMNKVSFKVEVDDLDKTTFGGNGYKARAGGLKDITLSLEGFWESDTADAVDVESFPDLGVADRVLTVAPTSDEASTAYMMKVGKFSYELGGDVGELMPFVLDTKGTNNVGVVRGQVAAAVQDVSATGALGSAVHLGAASSGQYVYAALHVFSAGTTITVKVESDDNSGFTSASNVGSSTITATDEGGYWLARVAGPITDTYYRLNVTAVTGTFSVAGAIGVQ